jgi:hypothetical protein
MIFRACMLDQLERDNAALKAKLTCMQLSLAQAEQANAASADAILQLQAEVSYAIHMERLCHGTEFLGTRKEARDLRGRDSTGDRPCATRTGLFYTRRRLTLTIEDVRECIHA